MLFVRSSLTQAAEPAGVTAPAAAISTILHHSPELRLHWHFCCKQQLYQSRPAKAAPVKEPRHQQRR
jgi:hypothetical protein